MTPSSSQILTVKPSKRHTATVIFVHGLGQSNQTWALFVEEAWAPRLPHVQFILPQAPKRSVSVSHGQRRPSWFDIRTLPPGRDEYDEEAIQESSALIENIILQQIHSGIDPRRIVLAGFSQGSALCNMVALSTLNELGGLVSLSGWIPYRARRGMLDSSPSFPILWCHGAADDEIPISQGQDAMIFLRDRMRVPMQLLRFKSYEGLGHTICDAEVEDIGLWLVAVLAQR